jgi:hypothetical protein
MKEKKSLESAITPSFVIMQLSTPQTGSLLKKSYIAFREDPQTRIPRGKVVDSLQKGSSF